MTTAPSLIHARTGPDHVLEPDLTPLHLAAQYGQLDIARLLLDRGADVNSRAPALKNMTPLHLAIWRGRKEELDLLPDPCQPAQSQGALRLSTAMPRLLLESGADVKAKDSERDLTPLGWTEVNLEDETDRYHSLTATIPGKNVVRPSWLVLRCLTISRDFC